VLKFTWYDRLRQRETFGRASAPNPAAEPLATA
jgi:hypothetical protein